MNQAEKRGGGQVVIPLDALSAETRYQIEPAHEMTPERLFERQWAITVLQRVLTRLQAENESLDGKRTVFERLKGFLTAGGEASTYAEAGAELGMSEGAVKVAVHRLRRRYRGLLREEIAQTVDSSEDTEDEIRYLLSCV